MKFIAGMLCVFLLLVVGCEQNSDLHGLQVSLAEKPSGFEPSEIRVVGLSEFVARADSESLPQLKVYIDLLDQFDSRIKAPGVFRLELYQYVPRSAEPRGGRLFMWADIDLTSSEINNNYWRDFLRASSALLRSVTSRMIP